MLTVKMLAVTEGFDENGGFVRTETSFSTHTVKTQQEAKDLTLAVVEAVADFVPDDADQPKEVFERMRARKGK